MKQPKEGAMTGLFSHATKINERLAGNWKRLASDDAKELAAIERAGRNALGKKGRIDGSAEYAPAMSAIERAHLGATYRGNADEGTKR